MGQPGGKGLQNIQLDSGMVKVRALVMATILSEAPPQVACRCGVSVGFLGSFQLLALLRAPSHLEIRHGHPALGVSLLSPRSP